MAGKKGNGSRKTTTQTNYRSAVTGRYVKEGYAKRHPKTTVKETDKVKKK